MNALSDHSTLNTQQFTLNIRTFRLALAPRDVFSDALIPTFAKVRAGGDPDD
ncbi:MAG TPA: hypothetical protein VHX14_01645 [Thermoanaerobaculia bacterium]|jgi:hypothetical protein|nr:hypothetical protein [Thermoanaerobaculia bacterium]